MDGKIIIWANYIYNIHDNKNIKDKFPDDRTVSVYGAVSVPDRDKAVENFQKDPYTKFLVGNPATGGLWFKLS